MNRNHFRTGLLGLAGITSFALSACTTPQPLPECNVTVSAAALLLAPYIAVLTPTSGTGACAEHETMNVGLQRYRDQPLGGNFTLGIKASLVVDPYLGYSYDPVDYDESNNCANEGDCQGEDDLADTCVVKTGTTFTLVDGGAVTPTTLRDGGSGIAFPGEFTADGGPILLDKANTCGVVEDVVSRNDPLDPDGKNQVVIGAMSQFPVDGICDVTGFTGGVQNFEALNLDLVDGTTYSLPAEKYSIEFTNFDVVSTAKVPGTAFNTHFKLTEGACVAEYDAVGFWPEVHCEEDVDCAPYADIDAGRVFGSGISPYFEPTCNKTLGLCVPSVDLASLK